MSLTSAGPLNPRKRPVPGLGREHFEAIVCLFNILAKIALKQLRTWVSIIGLELITSGLPRSHGINGKTVRYVLDLKRR